MTFEPPLHLFWIFWMGVAALVLIAVLVAVLRGPSGPGRQTSPPAPPPPPRETPLDILARRFASGEITAEDYQKARDLLQGGDKS